MHTRETMLRIVLLFLLIYSLANLLSVTGELKAAENLKVELEQQVHEARAENARLEQVLSSDYSAEDMEQMARDRLGLVLPGEKVFYFTTDREE